MSPRLELPLERSHWSVIDTSNDLHNRDVARLSTWISRSFGDRPQKVPKPWWLLVGKTNIAQMAKPDRRGGNERIILPHTNGRYALEDFDQDQRAEGTGSVPMT
jgi:hypothetical protein